MHLYIEECDIHASRLEEAYKHVLPLFPMTPEKLASLQQRPIEGMTDIDILNRLEKADLLPSATEWKAMRELKNHVTHEYPDKPELMVKTLNESLSYIKTLVDYWKTLRIRVKEIMDQLSTLD